MIGPVVQIVGDQAGDKVDGLVLQTADSTIKGLLINRFDGNGIVIEGENSIGNHIISNDIGVDSTGVAVDGNMGTGIVLRDGAAENMIGTNGDGADDMQEANVIGGNRLGGILIEGVGTDMNIVAGNYVGVDFTGEIPLANGMMGTFDGVTSNRLFSTIPADR